MKAAIHEDKLEVVCSGALCIAALLGWIYFACVWKSSYGQIKLPVDEDAALDEDVPAEQAKWRTGILYRKILCSAVSTAALLAWSVLLPTTGDKAALQVCFWVSSASAIMITGRTDSTVWNNRSM